MSGLIVKYNELTAKQFIELWETVWGDGPSLEQTELAMINELLKFINDNGVKGTEIFVELCAVPDKIPFYEKFGFEANEAQRLKLFHRVD